VQRGDRDIFGLSHDDPCFDKVGDSECPCPRFCDRIEVWEKGFSNGLIAMFLKEATIFLHSPARSPSWNSGSSGTIWALELPITMMEPLKSSFQRFERKVMNTYDSLAGN